MTIADLHDGPAGAAVPGLARAAASLGTPLVRTQATVGGNVMSALPYRNLLPVLLAVGADVELHRAGRRPRPALRGLRHRARAHRARTRRELLTAVVVPRARGFQDYVKVGPRNAQFVATASAAVAVSPRSSRRRVRLGFGNAADVPLRVPEADEIATQALAAGDVRAVGDLAAAVARGVDPPADHVASAAYRRHALGVLAGRLLERAIEEDR